MSRDILLINFEVIRLFSFFPASTCLVLFIVITLSLILFSFLSILVSFVSKLETFDILFSISLISFL